MKNELRDSQADTLPSEARPLATGVEVDARIYLAAERTFLAWIRTGIALMGFGFVLARFGLTIQEPPITHSQSYPPDTIASFPIGIGLILFGVLVNLVSVVKHRRYIIAIDQGNFRTVFNSMLPIGTAISLAIVGAVMTYYLLML